VFCLTENAILHWVYASHTTPHPRSKPISIGTIRYYFGIYSLFYYLFYLLLIYFIYLGIFFADIVGVTYKGAARPLGVPLRDPEGRGGGGGGGLTLRFFKSTARDLRPWVGLGWGDTSEQNGREGVICGPGFALVGTLERGDA